MVVGSIWLLTITIMAMLLGKGRIDDTTRAITMNHNDIVPKEVLTENSKRAYELTVADSLRLKEALNKVFPRSVTEKILEKDVKANSSISL